MRSRSLDKREMLRNLAWMSVLSVGITLYYRRIYGRLLVGHAVFLSGLLFLCVGLWRVVRRLGFFDSTIYGMKRLFGRMEMCYADYLEQNPYRKSFREVLITSLLFIAVSFFLQ